MSPDFLTGMAEIKRAELERLKKEVPLELLERSALEAPPARRINLPRPFEGVGVIAEVKKASPSLGDIDASIDPVRLALEYQEGGAAAVSVLTEPTRFKGSVEDLLLVRSRIDLPVLRKDFIIDPYELYRTRGLGADLVLLIVAMLDRDTLAKMLEIASELGLTPLVEIHSDSDAEAIEGLPVELIGVNNRDLKSLTVNIETSLNLAGRLLDRFPDSRLVAESGVDGPETVNRLARAGYSGVLIGEYLVRSEDRRTALAGMMQSASMQGNRI
jgi:indole-3-glycerol phosphate synthase